MSDPVTIQNEQSAKCKDWFLPWLLLSVLGGGVLGTALYVLYAVI